MPSVHGAQVCEQAICWPLPQVKESLDKTIHVDLELPMTSLCSMERKACKRGKNRVFEKLCKNSVLCKTLPKVMGLRNVISDANHMPSVTEDAIP